MKEKDNVFINDKVVRKLLNGKKRECREYLARIIGGVLNIREDFDHIKAALDELLYYNPEELERQADEFEREMARKEGREEGLKESKKQFVLKLYEAKVDKNIICKYTNMSYEEVCDILKL